MSVGETLMHQEREEARQKGIQEAKKIVAKRLIIGGYSTERIANITELTENDIEEIREDMLQSIE